MLDLAPASAGNKLAVTDGEGRETWANKRVSIVDLDTGVSRRPMPDDIASVCPAWSPDGSRIACSAGPDANIASNRANAGLTYRAIRPNGSVETKTITPNSNLNIGGGEEAHVYLQQRKIWLLDATGPDAPKRFTNDPRYRDEEPLWSADGSHILFGRMDYDGHTSLWLMDANGGGATQVCRLQIADDFGNQDSWFGYYGYTDWRKGFDWRR
jgi:Tol biopolymer transport system component